MQKVQRRSLIVGAAAFAGAPVMGQGWFTKSLGAQSEFFDPQYYANMNSDLLQANLLTYAQLRWHWLNWGRAEGRSAHPDIDPRAYMGRYADLRGAFGATNWLAGYNHYVSHGQYEGRNGRSATMLSAKLGDVSIATSGRSVGGLDSLFFNGRETVNAIDHGRQVQSALYDRVLDACFNPTQSGVRSDGKGYPSTSRLLSAQQFSNGFRTKTQAGYWVGPGETITDAGVVSCTANTLTSKLSGFTIDTEYRMQAEAGVTVITHGSEWIGDRPFSPFNAQVVPVTGYHSADFEVAYEIDAATNYAARPRQIGDHMGNTGEERKYPFLFFTPNGSHAIGVYCKPIPGASVRYAAYRWKYGQGQQTNDSSSWAIVNRYQDAVPAWTPMRAECFIVLGQATPVHLKLKSLMQQYG